MQKETSALSPADRNPHTAIRVTAPPQLIDAARCAAAISVPKGTLYKMVRGGLPGYRVGPRGRALRFDVEEVLAWLRRPSPAQETVTK